MRREPLRLSVIDIASSFTAGLSWYPAASLGKYRSKTVGRLRRDIPFSTGLCKVTQASARRWPCAERTGAKPAASRNRRRGGTRHRKGTRLKDAPHFLGKPLRPAARQRSVIVDIDVRAPHHRLVAIHGVDQNKRLAILITGRLKISSSCAVNCQSRNIMTA